MPPLLKIFERWFVVLMLFYLSSGLLGFIWPDSETSLFRPESSSALLAIGGFVLLRDVSPNRLALAKIPRCFVWRSLGTGVVALGYTRFGGLVGGTELNVSARHGPVGHDGVRHVSWFEFQPSRAVAVNYSNVRIDRWFEHPLSRCYCPHTESITTSTEAVGKAFSRRKICWARPWRFP